jgi:maltose alpha-D-glucosyltransferase / alpha-amylase
MVNKPIIQPVRNPVKEDLLSERMNWSAFEAVFQEYIKDRRWFRGKARHIQSCRITDVIPIHFGGSRADMVILQVNFTTGEPETYLVPLMISPARHANEVILRNPAVLIARVQMPDGYQDQICFEATADKDFCSFLLESIGQKRSFLGLSGRISTTITQAFNNIRDVPGSSLIPTLIQAEQSNTSIIYGNQAILKFFRRIENGINPEMEMGRFLTERTSFTNFAPLLGALEYRLDQGPMQTMAVLQTFVANKGDAWQYSLDSLEHYFQSIETNPRNRTPQIPQGHLLTLLNESTIPARKVIGSYLTSAQLLGQRTAELHKALSSTTDNPDFAPEPFSTAQQTFLYHTLRDLAFNTFQMLEERKGSWPEEIEKEVERVLKFKESIIRRFQHITEQKISAVLMRCHGDYHLGQVLYTGQDFVIIDFEGEPARPLSERRAKISPIQDVAGMLRSFDYAAHTSLNRQVMKNAGRYNILPMLEQDARYWYTWVSITFLNSYLEHIQEAHLIPENINQLKILLDVYLLEKSLYEVGYELNNRPEWLKVPVHGILQLMGSD